MTLLRLLTLLFAVLAFSAGGVAMAPGAMAAEGPPCHQMEHGEAPASDPATPKKSALAAMVCCISVLRAEAPVPAQSVLATRQRPAPPAPGRVLTGANPVPEPAPPRAVVA